MANEFVRDWLRKFNGERGESTPPPVTKPKTGASLYGSLAKNYAAPQTESSQKKAIPGREMEMVANSAEGMSFGVSPRTHLDRFLILGTDAPTYYASAKELTEASTKRIIEMLQGSDAGMVVDRIVEISESHRAYRNEPALFALALAVSRGSESNRRKAAFAVNNVARTGGDFLRFISYLDQMRGRGHQFNGVVRHWYNDRNLDELAYQVIKYQSRESWSHRDLLRIGRPTPYDEDRSALYGYITGGMPTLSSEKAQRLPDLVKAWEMIKASSDDGEILALIKRYNLTWEFVPNEKRSPRVWRQLAMQMPMGTTLRYLSNFTRHGLFEDVAFRREFINRITDSQFVQASKIHPIRVLMAHAVYQHGRGIGVAGEKGEWVPDKEVISALDLIFHLALRAPEPTRKRIMVALDVSGSMDTNHLVNDKGEAMPITAREICAAMSLSVMESEPKAILCTFSGDHNKAKKYKDAEVNRVYDQRFGPQFSQMDYGRGMDLKQFMQRVNSSNFGITDCSLPVRWATENRVPIDTFTIWTDGETWAGPVHPTTALKQYREAMGIDAKLVVCACTATHFSIADPKDSRQLDIVGFDANVASVIRDFIANDW